ncbi:hypothetical protein BWQ96_07480 [Gracilariopsis chorda]|uniref:Uncharacterized protein n=1 Tax=Gracilariopsis chorda TaxID=448386 RepID=A0A2V3IL35_9FLOR|nr:hypothetical protein BWQ96_07480 [Gracilariopsis chorda]|eukprot:PXF42773.1 hypothetical protein BWQ96_07480 [Gracilariopsis chorda]
MFSAFVTSAPLPLSSVSTFSTCPLSHGKRGEDQTLSPVAPVTMRCRRDLKKEKSLRNLEYARMHRKRLPRRVNRRAVQQAVQNEDNEYLSSVFDTIRFGTQAEKPKEKQPANSS